jgi:hypothetical protein
MPLEPPLFTEGLSQPPIRRYAGPIVDAHVHLDRAEDARLLARVAADFGVRVLCGVARLEAFDDLQRALGGAWRPIVRIDHSAIADPPRFGREGARAVREARARGAVAAKFWYTPRFIADTQFRFDNPALRPIFETLAELGMVALVHIADPDCWFAGPYADRSRYAPKPGQYEQLENTLAAFPALKVQGAHFGGDPEHLDHLRRLLDAHPNYCIDSSATKWMARELGARPAEARAFIIERADRILFGSDLVAFQGARPEDFSSRYWVHRHLWEGQGVRPSPVPDPCVTASGGPTVTGLALPDDVLARLYTENARRWFGIEA